MTVLCDSCSPRKQCTADKNRTECRFYQPLTNEEWLISLPTEEKAKVISRLDCYHGNVYEIEQWLKEKHE